MTTSPEQAPAAGRRRAWRPGARARQVGARRRGQTVAVAVAAGALILVAPSWLDFYTTQLVGIAMLFGIVAVSLDVPWGYAGILSMGHAVFFGLGDYGVGLASVRVTSTGVVATVKTSWWTFPAGALAGIGVAMVVAFLVGLFAFSGKGGTAFYVAVVTLALTVLGSTIFLQSSDLGGQNGLSNYAIYSIGPRGWFWIAGFSLLAVALVAHRVVSSDFGLLLRAIRDNEQRTSYFGFDVPGAKLWVFVASAGVAAAAGALYGGYVGFVSPPLLGFLAATDIIIWVAVGGRGTLLGPILGALLINVVGPQISARSPEFWTMVLGLLFILVVTFLPDGVFPALAKLPTAAAGLRGRRRRPGMLTAGPLAREVVATGAAASAGEDRDGDGLALSIEDLHRGFGGLKVLRGVSMEVRRRELLCIVGPNGAGKTTLLGVLSDGTVPHTGTVELALGGQGSLRGLSPRKIVRRGIGRKFQAPNLFESLTVSEVVLLAGRQGRVPSLWRRTTRIEVGHPVYRVMEAAGLLAYVDTRVADLPHGLKQALEVAATVALRPRVLLLDEPTAGLTAEERALIGDLLRHIVEDEGITVILIEHDFDFVRRIADRIAVLHDGKVLAIGAVGEVADSDLVRRAYLGVEA
jgi:branched-chain amino acid transport system permease protein